MHTADFSSRYGVRSFFFFSFFFGMEELLVELVTCPSFDRRDLVVGGTIPGMWKVIRRRGGFFHLFNYFR